MIQSAEEFVKLRESQDPEEYRRAAHETAPEEVWLEVIQKYPHMRRWVAHNKTVQGKILEILSCDEDENVRYKVAKRRGAGEKILQKLSKDIDESVRLAVACNPKVTKSLLLNLLNDEWEAIRETASERLSKFEGQTCIGKMEE